MSHRLSKLSTCIRRVANTARLARQPSSIVPTSTISGKYAELVRRIRNLDGLDMRDHGHKFKHMIFTDIREGSFGAKAIASFLAGAGFPFGMTSDGRLNTGLGNNTFALLQSQPLWGKPLTIRLKKEIIDTYNKRPDNVYGDKLRILVLDSKFKEGIDLFDVKYCHIMEEPIAESDMKQAVGRATRFCGQKGLPFVDGIGWTLNVFVYSTVVPGVPPFVTEPGIQKTDAHTLVMKHSGLDLSLLVLTKEITEIAIRAAVDRPLTREINPGRHHVGGSTFTDLYGAYAWPKQVLRNGCEIETPIGVGVKFTPTQDFIRNYFRPELPTKGLLAWHSVGTGKTCTAVATASDSFMGAGYRILWVTRNALMSDVWKNVFNSVCYMPFRRNDGLRRDHGSVSPLFMEPISYKMFQNALERKNGLGRYLYRANGEKDMLRRTLLVIDEVHKLHDGDLLATEKADFSVIQQFIWNSYKVSGYESVRPLLMTATPIGDTPQSLFDILNTLIPSSEGRLMNLGAFRREFVDSEGHVSDAGAAYFTTRAKGLISYLNRERDPTTFAIPHIKTVHVPLGDVETPDVRTLARTCAPKIAATNSKTRKRVRRSCYLTLRREFKDRASVTQKGQMAACFGSKDRDVIGEFPTYANFIGALDSDSNVANNASTASNNTTGAIRGGGGGGMAGLKFV